MRFIKYLVASVLAVVLAGAANAQPSGNEVPRLIDQMGRKMRMLTEDVQVEVRDARGAALAGQAGGILEQIQHMQAESREASPEHMREEAVELDQKFHQFIDGCETLGGEGQYLARSAERVEDLDHEVLRILGNPAPAFTPPVQPAPLYQAVPSVSPRTYVAPRYEPYSQWSPPYQRGVTVYFRR